MAYIYTPFPSFSLLSLLFEAQFQSETRHKRLRLSNNVNEVVEGVVRLPSLLAQ
jgi:hypothetical protein